MPTPWFNSLIFATSCLCGSGALLSLWLACGARHTRRAMLLQLLLGTVAVTAIAFALIAARAGQPLAIWGSAAAVAVLYGAIVVLPSPPVVRCATTLIALARGRYARRIAILGVPGLCPFIALALVYAELDRIEELGEQQLEATGLCLVEPTGEIDSPLTTDLGRPVRVLQISTEAGTPTVGRLAAQDRLLTRFDLHDRVIYLPLSWQNTNCHGFVFTAGKYWVGGAQVNAILNDNGYRAVATPQADDVAVYRDANGKVMHTGIVRGTASDGVTLIESKWGQAARFVHRHDYQPYPDTTCSFYRSPRPGHLLRGLNPVPSAEPMPAPPEGLVGL